MSPPPLLARPVPLLPGLALVSALVLLGWGLGRLTGEWLSPVVMSLLLGLGLATLTPLPRPLAPGIGFSAKTLLRLALMLLGTQITLGDLADLGFSGAFAILTAVAATLPLAYLIGRGMGLGRDIALLIASGTAICGASAIAGVNTVLRSAEEDVAYAVGTVTLFGTLGIFLLPVLGALLGLSPEQYGFWAGLSLHDVAQATAAGFAGGEVAGHVAVSVKLGRVLLLAAVVAVIARLVLGREAAQSGDRPPLMPWFLAGFLLLACANSWGLVPAALADALRRCAGVLMLMAMAGLGLGTNLRRLLNLGWAPLALGAIATLLISGIGLGFSVLLG